MNYLIEHTGVVVLVVAVIVSIAYYKLNNFQFKAGSNIFASAILGLGLVIVYVFCLLVTEQVNLVFSLLAGAISFIFVSIPLTCFSIKK